MCTGNRHTGTTTDPMDTRRDVKPFLAPVTSHSQRGVPVFGVCQAAPTPLGRGARVSAAPQQAACVVNRAASLEPEGGCSRDAEAAGAPARRPAPPPPPLLAARVSRKFWTAGDYDAAGGSPAQPPRNVGSRMCVHPKFLHSNATSHKWPFGAVAELLDNAVDEIKTGATRIVVDKIVNKRKGSPALLVQDDGGGMDPDSMRRCMSFGFSDKQSGSSIGQYGNGFKTSTMRLGADAIVFSRCMKGSGPTQSVGLLSYTFLAETGQKDVVVPMVDYKYDLLTGDAIQYERHGADQFCSNLSVLLKWSPFATEEDLMGNFSDIGPHGTKIVVFNLWSNDDGVLELDFDTKEEDIMISGAPNPAETTNAVKRTNENHLSNQLRYSLRVYASVLYLQLPGYFKIILRGQEVQRHSIATDLIYRQAVSYTPLEFLRKKEGEVVTSIGFLNGAPTISVHGFNIYHRNRLILPFHRVLSSASSKGRGVAGVLEANSIKPTHDKQDFEKSQLYQKLIIRLKDMTTEYWDLHSHLIGYQKKPRASVSPTPPGMLTASDTIAEPSERNAVGAGLSVAPWRGGTHDHPASAILIAFAPPHLSVPAGTSGHAPCSMPAAQMVPATDSAETRKRRNEDDVQMDPCKRQAIQSLEVDNQICQHMTERDLNEFEHLKFENQQLHEECLELEVAEKELLLKEQQLRLQIQQAEAQYKSLLNEYISATPVRTRMP
ncbi:protein MICRORCHIDIA 6-like isoform X1 [Triticum urartu]|nr:protein MICRORCHIDIA 6-like isoform X1 [Triticum urartu]